MQNLKLVRSQKSADTENLERIDFNIWVALIFLCCFGLIMVLSASSYRCASSEAYKFDSMYYFKRQALFVILGFGGILIFRNYDYRKLKALSFAAWILAIICIFLLLTPLGISVNGAKRWLGYGPVRFQVAEVVKIAVILFLANMVTSLSRHLNKIMLTFYLWFAGGIPAILLFVISNDLSSAIIVLGITFGISFICTKTFKMHIGVGLIAVIGFAIYVFLIWSDMPSPEELSNASFRVGRIAAWLDPERYADTQGYQVLQALYAIGNGGLLGKSLGNSTQKLYAIPEAHTDMIFSIVCEELGLIGATLLISLFIYLLYQLLRLALSTRDLFGSVVVLGIFLHVSIQTIINLAVNVNLFPNTGLTLPFISYGGTSIFLLLMEMSVVFSVILVRSGKMAAAQTARPRKKPSRIQQACMALFSLLPGMQTNHAGSGRTQNTLRSGADSVRIQGAGSRRGNAGSGRRSERMDQSQSRGRTGSRSVQSQSSARTGSRSAQSQGSGRTGSRSAQSQGSGRTGSRSAQTHSSARTGGRSAQLRSSSRTNSRSAQLRSSSRTGSRSAQTRNPVRTDRDRTSRRPSDYL